MNLIWEEISIIKHSFVNSRTILKALVDKARVENEEISKNERKLNELIAKIEIKEKQGGIHE